MKLGIDLGHCPWGIGVTIQFIGLVTAPKLREALENLDIGDKKLDAALGISGSLTLTN